MSAKVGNWGASFRKGVAAFRDSRFDEALIYFNEALANGGQRDTVYDSRAATFEKLGNIKAALRDAKTAIDLYPAKRQGYLRAARIFHSLKKYDAADQVIQLGLKALAPDKRTALEDLQENIRKARENQRPSPFNKLPVEMVLHIFGYIVEGDESSAAAVILSLVSTQWRTFVLSRPSYWESLVLSYRNPVHKAQEWMKRSKECIRHLVLRRNLPLKQLVACFDKLGVTFFKTLRSFYSEYPLVTVFEQFFHSQSSNGIKTIESLPCLNLEKLQLHVTSIGYTSSHRNSNLQFSHVITPSSESSCLHTLMVDHTELNWPALVTRLCSLRTLVLRWTNFELDITEVLRTNRELAVLNLEGSFNLNEVKHAVEMSKLVELQLRGPMEINRFMSLVSFPALEQLELCGISSRLNNVFTGLQTFAESLKCLHIRNCSFDDEHLLPLLSKLSKLETLTITHHSGDMNNVVELLAGPSSALHFTYSRLSQLNFSYSPHLTGGPLVRLVKSRLAAGENVTRIRVICIDGCPKIDPSVPEWLKSRIEKVSCIYMSRKEKYRREW